jgi:tetratricopeptide (TPR) repeat protein
LDLKTLSKFDTLKDRLTASRSQNAEKFTDQGLALLAQVLQQTQVADQKTKLMDAFDLFVKALSSQRTQPEPYIGIAFVLILVGNFTKATKYVKEAQRLAPKHPDVAILFEMIQDLQLKARIPAPTSPQTTIRPSKTEIKIERLDYDELYDQLEMQIITEVRLMMQDSQAIPSPSCEEQQFKKLKEQYASLLNLYENIQRQCQIVEQEIDISDLEKQLKPFTINLARFENALKISNDLHQLKENLCTQLDQVNTLLAEIKEYQRTEDLLIAEENLEILLDNCDLYANQLDEAESKKYRVQILLNLYENMIAQMESLQDLLDETKEHLTQKPV